MELEHEPHRRLITTAQLCKKYANRSRSTIWRWRKNPAMKFPKPIKINDINYYDEAVCDEHIKWLAERGDLEGADQ